MYLMGKICTLVLAGIGVTGNSSQKLPMLTTMCLGGGKEKRLQKYLRFLKRNRTSSGNEILFGEVFLIAYIKQHNIFTRL